MVSSLIPIFSMAACIVHGLLFLTTAIATTTALSDYATTGWDWVDSPVLGETFPSCVEVVSIHPEPNMVLKTSYLPEKDSHVLKFTITFSKPVLIEGENNNRPVKTRYDKEGHSLVFITLNAFNFRNTLPNWYLLHTDTSKKVLEAGFLLHKDVLSILRKIYLVVDGGGLYFYETIQRKHASIYRKHKVYVPLSIFGPYLFREEDKGDRITALMSPSPYCFPRVRRPLPVPFYTDPLDAKLRVDIPQLGHRIVHSDDNSSSRTQDERFTLHLSAVMKGSGKAAVSLPTTTLVANYSGINVTVRLPQWKLLFQKRSTKFQVPVRKVPVFELRERMYQFPQRKDFKFDHSFPSVLKLDTHNRGQFPTGIISKYHPRYYFVWRVEVFDPESNLKLMDYYTAPTTLRPYSSHGPSWDPKVTPAHLKDWLDKTASSLTWVGRSRTASGYALNYKPMGRGISGTHNDKFFLKNNIRKCPVGSKRNPGRQGKVYHTAELGPFYHMLVTGPPEQWRVERSFQVLASTNHGKKIDLTENVSLGLGEGLTGIPPRLLEALNKYVCLMRPLRNLTMAKENSKTVLVAQKFEPLEKCIFVPRDIAESQQCGGLRLVKNIKNVVREPNFCNKEFGDCIGLPYTSEERFPVIPPYGLPELGGWIRHKRDISESLRHPIGRHFDGGNRTLPRALHFHYWNDSIWLMPYIGSEQIVRNIPITGVKILEPFIDELGKGKTELQFCDTVWKLRALLLERGREMDAVLSASVHNSGKGGGTFVFKLTCTPQLNVKPSSGETQQWIQPGRNVTVIFKMDGSLVTDHEKKLHKCEATVQVRNQPELSQEGKESPLCKKMITTYFGAFRDPCAKDIPPTPLPNMDLRYYVLPPSQRHTSIKQFLNSPAGRPLVFIKAITVVLNVPNYEEELLFNLQEMKIYCDNPEFVILHEDKLLYEAVQSAEGSTHTLPQGPISIFDDFTAKKKVYYFATRQWASKRNSRSSSPTEPSKSGCKIEVWANRPHRLCRRQKEKQTGVTVPMAEADVATESQERAGSFGFLAPLYGSQTDGIAVALLLCLVASTVLIITTVAGHGILYGLRKKLPKEKTVEDIQTELKRAKQADKDYWDNPQSFLSSGPHGPHYLLHSFKATDALDTGNLKNLKVAGILRYKSKELQVMFGHVKKVFVDKKTKDTWLQTSSGMYLLPIQNVTAEYRSELAAFLQRCGIITGPDLDPPLPLASEDKDHSDNQPNISNES